VGVRLYVIANLETAQVPHVRLSRLTELATYLGVPVELLNPEAQELRKGGVGGRWARPVASSVVKEEVDAEIGLYDRPLRRGDCLTSKQRYHLKVIQTTRLGIIPPTPDSEGGDGLPDGINCQRPCPYVSCKHHLYVDVNDRTGGLKVSFPHYGVEEMSSLSVETLASLGEAERAAILERHGPGALQPSCALDVADHRDSTLEEVGKFMGVTRERIRQIESVALAKVKKKLQTPAFRSVTEFWDDDEPFLWRGSNACEDWA